MTDKLTFKLGNSKLIGIYTFSLPAGKTCPGAKDCFAMAVRKGKKTKLVRGKNAKFTCYFASLESIFPSLYTMTHRNWTLLKEAGTVEKMGTLIHDSLPNSARIIRIHPGGDFFNVNYFVAWVNVALNNPGIIFYAYTKSVHIWKQYQSIIPKNFILTASIGGKFDSLITPKMKQCEVVFSPEEAQTKNIPIDHDDSLAYTPTVKHFATLLHGKQAAGSVAAESLKALRNRGLGAYNSTEKNYVPSKATFKVLVSLPMVGVNKKVVRHLTS